MTYIKIPNKIIEPIWFLNKSIGKLKENIIYTYYTSTDG